MKDHDFNGLRRRLRIVSLGQRLTLLDVDTFSWFVLTDPRYIAAIRSLVEDCAIDPEHTSILAEVERMLPTPRSIPEGYRTLDRLTLLVTQACNARCVYCYADGGSYGSNPMLMAPTTARNAVRYFLQRFPQIKQIQFFGGEPFLNTSVIKYVMEFVVDLYNKGQIISLPRFTVVTNLTTFPPELPDLLEEFRLQLVVSVDGPAFIHDQLRPLANGKGSFERMYRHVRRIQQITDGRQPVAAEATYTAKHVRRGISLLEIYRFVQADLGIPDVIVTPVETDDSTLKITDETWYKSIHQVIQLGYRAFCEGDLVRVQQYLSPWLKGVNPENAEPWECELFCTAGVFSFAVDARGDIYPCQRFVGHPEFRLGSTVAAPHAFPSDIFEQTRQKMTSLIRKDHPECLSCPIRVVCAGCPAQWILADSVSASPVGPWCEQKRKLKIDLVALSLEMQEKHPERWHQLKSTEAAMVTC